MTFLKTYIKYISKEFFEIIVKISLVFYSLILILTIFEELNFFKETQVSLLYPIFLTFLNSPSVIYDIFPFIFLISTQFFFIRIFDKNELTIYKNFGLNNYKILKILTSFTLILSILIICIFYNLSAKLKFLYLDLKNNYADDNKYLAVITENGLWIKDEINDSVLIVNADSINNHFLVDVSIIELTKNFDLIRNIEAEKIDITNTKWKIFNLTQHINKDNVSLKENEMYLDTNFNLKKINNLFSDLSSLTMWELKDLKNDYKSLGYSTLEIDTHRHMIIAYPIYLTIMTMLSGIIMLNIKVNKSKMFNLLLGISLSVIIFYIKYFFNVLGENGKIPIILSIWFPLIILSIVCCIGLVRINEK